MKPKRIKMPKGAQEVVKENTKVIDTHEKSSQTFPDIDSRISTANRTKSDGLLSGIETE